MRSLYESLLSNTHGGVRDGVRDWVDRQIRLSNVDRGMYDVVGCDGGVMVVFNDPVKSPRQSIFTIHEEMPSIIKGIYYTEHSGKRRFVKLEFDKIREDKLDLSTLRFDYQPALLDNAVTIKWSHIKKLVGLPACDAKYNVDISQTSIEEMKNVDAPLATIHVIDGVIINCDDIKNCKLHRLEINDLILSTTIARRMQRDKKLNDIIVSTGAAVDIVKWEHAGWYFTPYYQQIIEDLIKDNKIDILSFFSTEGRSYSSQSVKIEKSKYGFKLVKF